MKSIVTAPTLSLYSERGSSAIRNHEASMPPARSQKLASFIRLHDKFLCKKRRSEPEMNAIDDACHGRLAIFERLQATR